MAPAAAKITSAAATSSCFQRPGRDIVEHRSGDAQPAIVLVGGLVALADRTGRFEAGRQQLDELHERSPRCPSDRTDTHLGPVVAIADRATLDRGDLASRNEIADAPWRPTEICSPGGAATLDGLAERLHEGILAATIAGWRWKVLVTRASGSPLTAARICCGSCPGGTGHQRRRKDPALG